jgi:hypothetical protein
MTGFDPPARNAGLDPAGQAFPSETAVVVVFAGVQLADLRRGRPPQSERTCWNASSVETSWVLA